MADCAGPLRPADSWSTTEVRSVTHSHVWTIKGFSQCECRYLETSAKIRDLTVSGSCCYHCFSYPSYFFSFFLLCSSSLTFFFSQSILTVIIDLFVDTVVR
ncbi:hypothetical protein ANCCAN_10321 [Ancylostoma caninum]|uniref:Uncharacterized protein n=1 Tax=Ancylostoma caninum TaxID=29170 RepID=A0A368GLA2_ANCCA|nr:hypothetical protein ANCCAN_10321 [Ancylostoma caninum]